MSKDPLPEEKCTHICKFNGGYQCISVDTRNPHWDLAHFIAQERAKVLR